MRKEMVIRIHTTSEKGHCKAIKVAAAITGVESVTIAGEDKKLLLVIGVGIDSNHITEKLRRKVGHAEVVELHTVDADEMAGRELVGEHPYRYHPSPSPYKQHAAKRDVYYTGARDHYYNGGSYAPATGGARDYYQYGSNGGYPAQYQQHDYFHHQPANMHTVVHHDYNSDPGCSIM